MTIKKQYDFQKMKNPLLETHGGKKEMKSDSDREYDNGSLSWDMDLNTQMLRGKGLKGSDKINK